MGMNVYVVAGLDKSIPMTTVFRGILWFLAHGYGNAGYVCILAGNQSLSCRV